MNPEERAELERLRRQQEALHEQVRQLGASLNILSEKLEAAPESLAPMEVSALDIPPLPMEAEPAAEPHSPNVPPPIPPIIPPTPAPAPILRQIPEPPPLPPIIPTEAVESRISERTDDGGGEYSAAPEEKRETSFEMRLGTYWLVRIGIVVLLTGLVFLGNYAYETFAVKFGPPGKLAMLYMASGLLIGFGAWLQRPAQKKSLKQYGQVVFAGGLAAAYFTTYAAHHIPALRVIENPVVDGILLLLFAGIIFWIADRRKSQVLALFAVGLAYYTSIITNIGLFTLYSNLVLSITAVLFLVRNRWATISFASLVGTYLGFAFWWFHGSSRWPWDEANSQFWNGILFLSGYWSVFTSAVFLSRQEPTSGKSRTVFLTMNNAWYFALAVLSMLAHHREEFWKFAVGFGAVLLLCATFSRRRFGRESGVFTAYLAQGLVILTIGIIAHFSGLQLALMLAGQSVVLFVLSQRQGILTMKIGAFATALLATHAAIRLQLEGHSALLVSSVGALLFFNAIWSNRSEEKRELLRPVTTFFSLLALIIWFFATFKGAPELWRAPLFAAEAILLTFSIYFLRCREVAVLGQSFLLVAQGLCLMSFAEDRNLPWWNAASVIVVSLGLSHWWKHQKRPELGEPGVRITFEALYALGFTIVSYAFLKPYFFPNAWLAMTSACAVGILIYAIATRAWLLAAASQFFLVLSVNEFILQVGAGKPAWYFALAPIATLLLVSFSVSAWLASRMENHPEVRTSILRTACLYRWVAIGLSLSWIFRYVPTEHYFLTLACLGAGLFAIFGSRKNGEGMLAATAYLSIGYFLFFGLAVRDIHAVNWWAGVALLFLPVLQQLAKRRPGFYELSPGVQGAMMIIGGLALWLYVSQWVIASFEYRLFLTVTWALFAFVIFGAGWLLRERVYRWFGLTILGCALLRIFIVDVWRLDTIYRILSFMALGVVLLVLGFVYNKSQAKP
jgi:uncharacterized membrane protein